MIPLLLAVGLLAQQRDTATFLDPRARELVTRARAARAAQAAGFLAYTAVAKQRIYLGLRALRRDRVFYHSEVAARVHWHRAGRDSIEMLGAREGIPIALPHDGVPEDVRGDAPDLLWDPAADRMSFGNGNGVSVHHPLSDSAGADYQFRTGDTTTITLPSGSVIEIYELKVIPRRADPRLMAGSIWIESRGYSMVRALFQLARPWDLELDLDSEARGEVNRHLPGFLTPIRGELKFASVEFALWQNRWWVPRLQSLDGVGTAGAFATFPVRFETAFSDYVVDADTTERVPPPPPPPLDSAAADSLHRACRADSLGTATCQCDWDWGKERHTCRPVTVILPADTLALLSSPDLPPSFVSDQTALATRADLEDILSGIQGLPTIGLDREPRVQALLRGPGLLRYNRVEALSLGARATVPIGGMTADGTLRVATSDGQPDLDAGLTRKTQDLTARFDAYRRISGVDPDAKSLGFGNSLEALVLGRDDGDYFRAAGAEFTVQPAVSEAPSYEWRLYAEHQFTAPLGTEQSLAHWFDRGTLFRPAIAATRADEIGSTLRLRGDLPLAQGRAGLGGNVVMDLAVGTYGFGRLALTGRATTPLPGSLQGAVEVSGGASAGTVPLQSHWFLGGPTTVRGYGGNAMNGTAFWRARAEVAFGIPGARLAAFSDAGWAGTGRDAFTSRPLISTGIGASFLDGLFRIDLARGLTRGGGTRLELYTDAVL